MFETLYCDKLRFDWDNMSVSILRGTEYVPLNMEQFRTEEFAKNYNNWLRTLNYLAMEYKACSGPKFKDCPVDDSKSVRSLSIYNKNELRIEINMFIFVGIYLGYMTWQWDRNYLWKTEQLTLFKVWFEKGYYLKKKIIKKGA